MNRKSKIQILEERDSDGDWGIEWLKYCLWSSDGVNDYNNIRKLVDNKQQLLFRCLAYRS